MSGYPPPSEQVSLYVAIYTTHCLMVYEGIRVKVVSPTIYFWIDHFGSEAFIYPGCWVDGGEGGSERKEDNV